MPGLMVVMFLGVLGPDSDRQILQSTPHFTGHSVPDAGDHHPRGHREIRGWTPPVPQIYHHPGTHGNHPMCATGIGTLVHSLGL